jgi:hypothetical protein
MGAHAAHRGGRGGHGPMCGHGDGGFGGGRGGGHGGGRGNKIPWQVCVKPGHSALRCYKRFDANYNGEEKHANTITSSYNINTNWYTDTGATYHIMFELEKLVTREKYNGAD